MYKEIITLEDDQLLTCDHSTSRKSYFLIDESCLLTVVSTTTCQSSLRAFLLLKTNIEFHKM